MFHHYSAPEGFNFDTKGIVDSFVDDPELQTFNADFMCEKLLEWIMHMKDHYRSNNLLMPFGDDFNYEDARLYLRNLDHLIKYFNGKYGENVQLMYSTPGTYIDAINAKNITWPTKYDDMIQYSDTENDTWTGFYTTRPNQKDFIKRASNSIKAANKLYSEKMLDPSIDQDTVTKILNAKDAMFDAVGLSLHHDTITGTSKQVVVEDNLRRVFNALQINYEVYAEMISEAALKIAGVVGGSPW